MTPSRSLLVTASVLWIATDGCAVAMAQGNASHRSDRLSSEILSAHAAVRAEVGVPPLTWSPRMASLANEWAHHLCGLARGGRAVLEHRRSPQVGENLFWQGGGDPPTIDAAVQSWRSERRFFDPRSGQCRGGQCGHYTQLVWRGTTTVGCAEASCGEHHFWVCDYDPPGNWVGQRPY